MKKLTLIAMLLIATAASKASATELKLCFFADADVDRAVAEKLVASWNKKEGKRYDLPARVAGFEHSDLNGISPVRFMQQPNSSYLKDGCDRNVALVGRSASHTAFHALGLVMFGLPLPEVLGGAVHSHMTVRAKFSTANQLYKPPSAAFRHELLHTLGCGHDTVFGRRGCGKAVRDLKTAQISEFFPAVFPIQKAALKHTGGIYTLVNERAEINRVNHEILVELHADSQKQKRAAPKRRKG